MPEFRKDPLLDRWVIIAPERSQRPIEFEHETYRPDGFDPFAEGNESSTPSELLAVRSHDSSPDGPGWRVRVVPNKFGALDPAGDPVIRNDGLYSAVDAVGSHEVVIECPHFEVNLSRLSAKNVEEVLGVYRDRLLTHERDPRLKYTVIFKNKGPAAGASLAHAHSQIMAIGFVPKDLSDELASARHHFETTGQCPYAEVLAQELTTASRIVFETPHFVVYCPYASRFAYEMKIVPRRPGSHFGQIQPEQIQDLAEVLKKALQKIESALSDPPYNFVLRTAPFRTGSLPYFRWHIEIYPRIARAAGFEWGTGCFINIAAPEDAAETLRSQAVD
ncbi:galactose-1-phosphate uridylyltransferase [Stratiformator vulcanicus]|uniref:Galactose-1-phosphate uridylyltransferase n=1 Tax=Stratiformator vulcanicus TaxID=2527980 RepID=A0A517QXS7_9PLAN|nr:galactose-1-phosphate uridylyltransferase [Stratiformator vulcanicus]QDT36439.1 Galactose-1-phosphate uridylyltransferase [Stratiformator vulcanicus]